MADLSNNSLALILVVSVAVFLIGVYVSVSHSDDNYLTGYAVSTKTGQAQLTVTSVTELTNQMTSMNWGSGYINQSYDNCTIDSENNVGVGCSQFSAVSTGFLLENTGNTNVSVNYSSNKDAASFIGGTGPEFKIKISPNSVESQSGESSNADSAASCENGWSPSSYTEVTTGGSFLCGSISTYPFSFEAHRDAAVVDVKLVIPEDAAIEAKTATLTFNAVSS